MTPRNAEQRSEWLQGFCNQWARKHYRFSMTDDQTLASLKDYTLAACETCPLNDIEMVLMVGAFVSYLEARYKQGWRVAVEYQNGNYNILPINDNPTQPTWQPATWGQV